MGGRGRGFGNKIQLRPAKAGAGAWLELGNKSCNYGVGGRLPLNLHLFPPPPCAKNDVVYELLTNLPIAHRKNG